MESSKVGPGKSGNSSKIPASPNLNKGNNSPYLDHNDNKNKPRPPTAVGNKPGFGGPHNKGNPNDKKPTTKNN